MTESGSLKVLLVTTRGQALGDPEGWADPRSRDSRVRRQGGFRGAGLIGNVQAEAVGSFQYLKRLGSGRQVRCTVEVFPLHVDHQRPHWLEKGERETRWVSARKAASLVSEPELKKLLLHFAPARTLSDGAEVRSFTPRSGPGTSGRA